MGETECRSVVCGPRGLMLIGLLKETSEAIKEEAPIPRAIRELMSTDRVSFQTLKAQAEPEILQEETPILVLERFLLHPRE